MIRWKARITQAAYLEEDILQFDPDFAQPPRKVCDPTEEVSERGKTQIIKEDNVVLVKELDGKRAEIHSDSNQTQVGEPPKYVAKRAHGCERDGEIESDCKHLNEKEEEERKQLYERIEQCNE